MSEKAKTDKPSSPRSSPYVFLILWVLAQAVAWLGLYVLIVLDMLPYTTDLGMGLILGLLIGIPTVLLQKLLMRMYFARNFIGWVRWGILAWTLGGLAVGTLEAMGFRADDQWVRNLEILALTLPANVAQAWVIRKHVNRSWLLLIASITGASLFSLVFEQAGNNPEVGFIAFGAYALATGLTMLWLFGMSRTVDKRKIQEAQEYERLEDNLKSQTPIPESEAKNQSVM